MENVEHTPRFTIDDAFAADRPCAICGETRLTVVHNERLPDYVKCGSCSSAFVLSIASDSALYGSIPAGYPNTVEFALKQWAPLEAIGSRAEAERASDRALQSGVGAAEPATSNNSESLTPPFGLRKGDPDLQVPNDGPQPSIQATTPPFGIGELDELKQSPDDDEDGRSVFEKADAAEPEPDHRFVVTVAGTTPQFPQELCAHCLRQPAPRKQIAEGALGSFEVPLCEVCHQRTTERSAEQKSARIIAHLSSVLIAAALVVAALGVGLVSIEDIGLADFLLLGTLAIVGYALPAVLLLGRSSRLPPSPDAQFVRTTMRFGKPEDGRGIMFGFRNRGYAERFSGTNSENVIGELVRINEAGSAVTNR